ncbi:MAG: hypothetical protein Q9198_009964 [Flavoplaca austrocitrina]
MDSPSSFPEGNKMHNIDPSAPRPSYDLPNQASAEQYSRHYGYGVNTTSGQAGIGQQPRDYYSNVVHGGNVHFGDRYYVVHETYSEQQRLDRLLESLRFPELNLRANQISDSYPETFQWLLRGDPQLRAAPQFSRDPVHQYRDRIRVASAEFRSWLVSNNPIFWIYGIPGSGKSTLMKFLATHETTRRLLMSARSNQASNVAILQHYFWLSGSEDQRSLKGCLASLLRQLFQVHSQLVPYLINKNEKVRNLLGNKRDWFDWSTKDLKSVFLEGVKMMISPALPCCIFIDGD